MVIMFEIKLTLEGLVVITYNRHQKMYPYHTILLVLDCTFYIFHLTCIVLLPFFCHALIN